MKSLHKIIAAGRAAAPAVLLAAALFFAAPLHAEPAADVPPREAARVITLQEAIELSGRDNIELRQSHNQIESDRISVDRQRGDFMPDLSISASASARDARAYDPVAKTTSDNNSVGLNTSIQSSLTLFDGLGNVAGLNQAKSSLRASEYGYGRRRETTAFQTAS